MNEFQSINVSAVLAALAYGALLGLMYFGGLWLSCSRLASTERNRLLLTLSFFLRICLLMSGFYWIHDVGAWEQFIPTLIGFLLFRALILHRMKPVTTRRSPPPQQSLWS